MKNLKRITAILLSIVMLISLCVVGLANQDTLVASSDEDETDASAEDVNSSADTDVAEDTEEENTTASVVQVSTASFTEEEDDEDTSTDSDVIPMIILPGINQSRYYLVDDEGNIELSTSGIIIIDDDNIVWKAIKTLLLPLIGSLLLQWDIGLSDAVYDLFAEILWPNEMDTSGETVQNIVCEYHDGPISTFSDDDKSYFYRMLPMQSVVSEMEEVYGVEDGEDYVYFFAYPLLGDPMETAADLVEYIEMVKEQCGTDKVNLVAVSMGGTILDAYLELIADEYDSDYSSINKIINLVSALDGTDIIADFLARDWNLSDEFLYYEYLPAILSENGSDEAIGHLINLLLRIFPNKVLMSILTSAWDAVLDYMLVNNPQIWALVPNDRYDELAEKYLSGDEYAELKAKTDAYHEAQGNLTDNLTVAKEQYGVEVYTISGYGLSYFDGEYNFFGIVSSTAESNGDGVIPVDSSSLGATYVAVGETIEDGENVSADGSIDTSTCFSEETAWFVYQQAHEIGYNDIVVKLCAKIICGEITDIYSDEDYPQYLTARKTKTLTRWYFDYAETIIANEDGLYTEAQIAAVQEAYDAALAVYNDTTADQDAVDEVTVALQKAVAATGLADYSEDSGEAWYETLIYTIIEWIDEIVYKIYGGKGYIDLLRDPFDLFENW